MTASSGFTPVPIAHETLDQAADLGLLSPGVSLGEVGAIGNGPDGASDVVWYSFSLNGPARLSFDLSRLDPSSSFNGVLSLYNDDVNDWMDIDYTNGYRMIDQVDGASDGGVTSFDTLLGQGTYYLAVSGDGNLDFNPLLADSGMPGSTGDFNLQIAAEDAGLGSATGPQVLTSNPAAGAVLGASPLAIRVDLSGPLDTSTIIAGQTVQLLYSPDGNFAVDGQPVSLNSWDPVNFSSVVQTGPATADSAPQYQGLNELQIFPAGPMATGYYQVILDGQAAGGATALTDPNGNPLGADAAHPQGQDITIPFQVDGIEGRTGADAVEDDTPATAQQLGNLTDGGLIQVAGAIGDDPGPDTTGNPANQVDLYHFTVDGPGNSSLVAEVFAGRIGSTLSPGISLFRLDPTTGTLVFVAGNIESYNPATADDGSVPLYTDPVLYAGLTPGDYYLAVADASNTASPLQGYNYVDGSEAASTPLPPDEYGMWGLYDPNDPGPGQLGSPQNGWSTGPYVLNLLVQPAPAPPQVVSTSPAAGSALTEPPTQVVVTFSQLMAFAETSFQTFQVTSQDTVAGVYIEAADGTKYDPRFESYDSATNQATFLMLDALPNGVYELHLSGAAGLVDMGGNSLVGNDPSGDYVVSFLVDAAPRGSDGDPTAWSDQEPNDSIDQPQVLGPLFPDELANGVTITRDFSQDPAAAPRDTEDVYQFQVLLYRYYTFALDNTGLPAGVTMTVTDPSGRSAQLNSSDGGTWLTGSLPAGTYDLIVSGWQPSQAASIAYTVTMAMPTLNDNAPPLLSGSAPAAAILLDSLAPPSSPSSPPPVTPPPVTPTAPSEPSTGAAATGVPTSTVPGPSPVVAPTNGTSPTTISTPAAAVLAIAVPAEVTGGQAGLATTSTDVVALAASPMGGVVAPASVQASSAQLATSGGSAGQSSSVAGLVVMGTSLQVIRPDDDAAAPAGGPEGLAELVRNLRDRGALLMQAGQKSLATAAGLAGRSSALAAGFVEWSMSPAEGAGEGDGRDATGAGPRVETIARQADAGPAGPLPDGRRDRDDRPRRSVGDARAMVLAFTGLAMGTYARYRRLLRRDGRRIDAASAPGPHRRPAGPDERRPQP